MTWQIYSNSIIRFTFTFVFLPLWLLLGGPMGNFWASLLGSVVIVDAWSGTFTERLFLQPSGNSFTIPKQNFTELSWTRSDFLENMFLFSVFCLNFLWFTTPCFLESVNNPQCGPSHTQELGSNVRWNHSIWYERKPNRGIQFQGGLQFSNGQTAGLIAVSTWLSCSVRTFNSN